MILLCKDCAKKDKRIEFVPYCKALCNGCGKHTIVSSVDADVFHEMREKKLVAMVDWYTDMRGKSFLRIVCDNVITVVRNGTRAKARCHSEIDYLRGMFSLDLGSQIAVAMWYVKYRRRKMRTKKRRLRVLEKMSKHFVETAKGSVVIAGENYEKARIELNALLRTVDKKCRAAGIVVKEQKKGDLHEQVDDTLE